MKQSNVSFALIAPLALGCQGAFAVCTSHGDCLDVQTTISISPDTLEVLSYSTATTNYLAYNREISAALNGLTSTANGFGGFAEVCITDTALPGEFFLSQATGIADVYESDTQLIETSSASQTAPIPKPRIILGSSSQGSGICNGTDVAGTTRNVVVGERIEFSACLPQVSRTLLGLKPLQKALLLVDLQLDSSRGNRQRSNLVLWFR